ncbi:MAG: FkbM family methyltransferase [Steroidobacteraceae bacterium]
MKRELLKFANSALRPFGIQIYKHGFDMDSVLAWTAQRAQRVRTVIDIGASTGRWSRAALPLFPDARFIGIDPLIEREPALKRLKGAEDRFDYVLGVAGENDGESVELTVSADLDGSTVSGHGGTPRKVRSYSLDGIVQAKRCQGSFLVKFDTHGFEVPILKGAVATLRDTDFIIMECYMHRHTPGTLLFHEMCAHLETLDFRCYHLADPMLRSLDGACWQMDLFFARKDDPIFCETQFR